jgi:hypothetical protein
MKFSLTSMFGPEFYIGFGIGILISAGVATWYAFGHELKQAVKRRWWYGPQDGRRYH